MTLSFLFYKVNRKLCLSHSSPPSLQYLSPTCAALHSFCSTTLCFFIYSVPCLFVAPIPHVAQLPFAQKILSLVFLSFCFFVVTSSTLYKGHYFLLCHLPFHAHHCSSWGQSSHSTVSLHLLPYPWWWYLLLLPFSLFHPLWTLPLLVFFFSTPKILYLPFHHFLSPHLPYSTLHHPIL